MAATSVAALGRDADVALELIAELEARGGGGSPDVAQELAAALIHELEAPGGAAAGGGGGGEPRWSPIAAVLAATSIAQAALASGSQFPAYTGGKLAADG